MISSLSVPEQHSESDGSTYLPPRRTRRRWRQYKSSTPRTENPRIWVRLGCNKTSREFLRAPRAAIGAVKLQKVTSGRWTVTAEVASSSLVVPAISQELIRSAPFSRGPKRHQPQTRWNQGSRHVRLQELPFVTGSLARPKPQQGLDGSRRPAHHRTKITSTESRLFGKVSASVSFGMADFQVACPELVWKAYLHVEIHVSPCRRDTSNHRILSSAWRALGHIHTRRHKEKE
jgi:hypothetical protein